MKSKNIVICDSEEGYANHLAQWLLEKKEMNFQIHIMNDVRLAEKFAKQQGIHILIVDDGIEKEARERIVSDYTIFLYRYAASEEKGKHVRRIFKYQSVDSIFKEVLNICMQEEDPFCFRPAKKGNRQLLAVYSPINRIGKTTFAWELARTCAKKGKTLYFSTDAYTVLPKETDEEGFSVSDLLYFAGQESCRIGIKVSAAALHDGRMQYLNPPASREDVCQTDGKEWYKATMRILEEGIYEYVVVEPEGIGRELFWFLDQCGKVFVPFLDRRGKKAERFLKDLKRTGYVKLEERLQWVDMGADWKGEILEEFGEGEEHGEA